MLLSLCIVGPQLIHSRAPLIEASLTSTQAEAKFELYLDGVAKKLDPKAARALNKIEGLARKLLAVRGYLRSGGSLNSKWSWTDEEISRYKASAEHKAAMAEVEKVKAKFAEQNPGYELYVNTQVRSLDAQIKSWNATKSVQASADELLAAALSEVSGQGYKDQPDGQGVARFQKFLQNQKLSSTPTVATPGLSPHGQLRAFDFQIVKDGKVIAGTDSSIIKTVWDGQGWTEKLKKAVTAASTKFTGPLTSPREPWHYNYAP